MRRVRDKCIRSARSGVHPRVGLLLVGLLCLALAVAGLPVCASVAPPTHRSTAAPVPGAAAVGSAVAAALVDDRTLPGLRGPRSDLSDAGASAKAIRTSRSRGGKLVVKRYPRADALLATAAPAVPVIVRDQALRSSSVAPSAHFPSAQPGRSPPPATS